MKTKKKPVRISQIILYVILIVLCLFWVFPLFYIIHPSSPFPSSKTSCFFIAVVPPPSSTFIPKCTPLSC